MLEPTFLALPVLRSDSPFGDMALCMQGQEVPLAAAGPVPGLAALSDRPPRPRPARLPRPLLTGHHTFRLPLVRETEALAVWGWSAWGRPGLLRRRLRLGRRRRRRPAGRDHGPVLGVAALAGQVLQRRPAAHAQAMPLQLLVLLAHLAGALGGRCPTPLRPALPCYTNGARTAA